MLNWIRYFNETQIISLSIIYYEPESLDVVTLLLVPIGDYVDL